jgi:hypothetical protein
MKKKKKSVNNQMKINAVKYQEIKEIKSKPLIEHNGRPIIYFKTFINSEGANYSI